MAQKLSRLDRELVARKIARSREQAQAMIAQGRVIVAGIPAHKPATSVSPEVSIKIIESENDNWASRGSHKLLGALDAFPEIDVENKKVLDAGASTGGFTDVLLRKNAREVWAVDVGYGQLIWRLQNDPRVKVLDRTNVRFLTSEMIEGEADMMVGDLSFISLDLVLPALASAIKPGGVLLPMVKPQFEVGKDRLGAGGVVHSLELRHEAVEKIAESAVQNGLSLRGVVASPLPGPSGNVEYFLYLLKDDGASAPDRAQTSQMIQDAIEKGPQ